MGEKKKKGSISYAKWGYIFIAPFFIIFAVFQLIPLASTIYYSFFEYYRSGLKIIGPNFVGLKNYITLFATDLPKYFGNTLILWIIGFIPQIAISLLLAAWFTDLRLKLKGQTFFKTVIYMPNLIMASAFAMLFFALFSDNGPVNAVLQSMGWIDAAQRTKGEPGTPQFRQALRDAIFETREVVGTHGVYNFKSGDLYGVDKRARVIVKLDKGGKWTLMP